MAYRTLTELEFMHKPLTVGDLLARLMGLDYMKRLAAYAKEGGYIREYETIMSIIANEELYLREKERLCSTEK